MADIQCCCPGTWCAPFRTHKEDPCTAKPTQEDGLCDYCRVCQCPTAADTEEAFRRWIAHTGELIKNEVPF